MLSWWHLESATSTLGTGRRLSLLQPSTTYYPNSWQESILHPSITHHKKYQQNLFLSVTTSYKSYPENLLPLPSNYSKS